ncbi:hypothetical protein ACN4EG_27350, partial [Alkalinema pantanalense CENA528]|uniref:hypothetical protein n=1 Tax=Alkalinema pantanalense TaxID=1620705 RepID=UPI003D6F0887
QFAQHFIVFWAKNDTERGWHFKEKKVPSILHLIYPSYLLAAGIDVFSTVNIQHVESLRDVVSEVPGIIVKSQLPDLILKEAGEVVVVDATPETLQERLRDGKIFPSVNAERLLNTAFQWQSLITLRELTLRQVANNVEETRIREGDRLNNASAGNLGSPCCVHERVLVCVSTHPRSIQLLNRGAHLANIMNASLYGLFIHNLDRSLNDSEALYINTCEQLCQDFRGEFLQVNNPDIATAIAHVAKTQHITQVMLGKTRRSFWDALFHRSIVEQLIERLPSQTDLHIISTDS